jgi:hypothetical protein
MEGDRADPDQRSGGITSQAAFNFSDGRCRDQRFLSHLALIFPISSIVVWHSDCNLSFWPFCRRLDPALFLEHTYNEIPILKSFTPFPVLPMSENHFQWASRYVTESKFINVVQTVSSLQPDFIFVMAASSRGIESISFLSSMSKQSVSFECRGGIEGTLEPPWQQRRLRNVPYHSRV